MEVSYKLEPGDLVAIHEAFNKPAWGARHWGRYERLRLILAGVALGALIFMLTKLYAQRLAGVDLVPWLDILGAMGGGAFMGWLWGRRKPAPFQADSPLLQPRTLSLNAEGFAVRGEGFDIHIGWNNVRYLQQAGDYLLIATRWDDLHPVPLRAFASPQEGAAFLAGALALRQAALHPHTPEPPALPIETLRYRLTHDDVLAFFALKRELRGWRGALIYILLFPCMAVVNFVEQGADDATWWTGMGLGIAAAWLLSRLILHLDRRIAIARYPLPAGEVELQRWEDRLEAIADGGNETIAWESIGNVVATPGHIFVMISPTKAAIIPRRAFGNETGMNAFAAEIDRRSREAVA